MKKTQINSGNSLDRAALLTLTHQVRDLLWFHQSMGIKGYPGRTGLANLFRNRNHTGVVAPAIRHKNKKPEKVTAKKSETAKMPVTSLSLSQKAIQECRRCPLAGNRLGQVIGRGSQEAKLMIVGDWSHQQGDFSPDTLMGREEDTMLWRMMKAIDQGRQQIFVTNVIKCCPAEREVDKECIRLCTTHLDREILSVQPTIILAMGAVAAHILVDTDDPLVRLRGSFYPCRRPGCQSIQVMVSFHPCFLVQNPDMKQMSWDDLKRVKRHLLIS